MKNIKSYIQFLNEDLEEVRDQVLQKQMETDKTRDKKTAPMTDEISKDLADFNAKMETKQKQVADTMARIEKLQVTGMSDQTKVLVDNLKKQMELYKTELEGFKKMKDTMSTKVEELKKKEKQ